MGQWNISINGTGAHHNKLIAIDANRLAAELVQKLRDAGHAVTGATFTHGVTDDISDPASYLDDRDAIEGKPEANRVERCAKATYKDGAPLSVAPDGPPCRRPAKHIGVCMPPVEWK